MCSVTSYHSYVYVLESTCNLLQLTITKNDRPSAWVSHMSGIWGRDKLRQAVPCKCGEVASNSQPANSVRQFSPLHRSALSLLPLNTGNLFLFKFILHTFNSDLPKHECEEWHDNMLPLVCTCHLHRPWNHDTRSGKCVSFLHWGCHGMCNRLTLLFCSSYPPIDREWLMCQEEGSNCYFSYALWCSNASSLLFFLPTGKGTIYLFKVHPQ